MQHRIKKAAYYAVLLYCAAAGLLFGTLRAAQQTRRLLYGGTPCMAQKTASASASAETDGSWNLSLGGGEWQLSLPARTNTASAAAESLPPCSLRLVLRLFVLADQTAEWAGRMYASSFIS